METSSHSTPTTAGHLLPLGGDGHFKVEISPRLHLPEMLEPLAMALPLGWAIPAIKPWNDPILGAGAGAGSVAGDGMGAKTGADARTGHVPPYMPGGHVGGT